MLNQDRLLNSNPEKPLNKVHYKKYLGEAYSVGQGEGQYTGLRVNGESMMSVQVQRLKLNLKQEIDQRACCFPLPRAGRASVTVTRAASCKVLSAISTLLSCHYKSEEVERMPRSSSGRPVRVTAQAVAVAVPTRKGLEMVIIGLEI